MTYNTFHHFLKHTDGKLLESLSKEFTCHMELLQEEMKARFSDVNEHVAKCAWVMDSGGWSIEGARAPPSLVKSVLDICFSCNIFSKQ